MAIASPAPSSSARAAASRSPRAVLSSWRRAASPLPEADAPASAEPQRDEAAGEPLRRCIVTRKVRPRRLLMRFVIGPQGELVPDVAARLPGRGLWLMPRRDVLALAVRKNIFARAAGGEVTVAPDLVERVEELLVRRCLDMLGLARRAGQAAAGFDQVRDWIVKGRAALLLAARDGAAEGRRKLRAAAPQLPVVEVLDATELAQALGRERVIHAALAAGRLAERFAGEAERLAGFRQPAEKRTD